MSDAEVVKANRKLEAAMAGGDDAVLTTDEARLVHDLLRPVVSATIEHSRDAGQPTRVLTGNDRTLALASTMVEVCRERYRLPDNEMDTVLSIGLMVLKRAEAGDEAAWEIMLAALGRLAAAVSHMDKDRAGKHAH